MSVQRVLGSRMVHQVLSAPVEVELQDGVTVLQTSPRTPTAPAFSSHSTAGKHGGGRRCVYVHTVGYIGDTSDSTPVCPLFFSIFMVCGRLKLTSSKDASSWF